MAKVESDNRPHIGDVIVRPSDPNRRRFRIKEGPTVVFYPKQEGGTALVVVDTGNLTGISTGGHAALETAAEDRMGRTDAARERFKREHWLIRASIDPVVLGGSRLGGKTCYIFRALQMASIDSARLPSAEYVPPQILFYNPDDRERIVTELNRRSKRHPVIDFQVEEESPSQTLVATACSKILAAGGINGLLCRYDSGKSDHLRRISD